MTPSDPGAAWVGAHLYHRGDVYGREGDRVVLEVAEPFVERALSEGWADGFFFLRYWEDGAHVRLRLRGDPGALEAVRPALEAHVRAAWPWPEGAELRWVPYEPEIDRYGGPHAMPLGERLFESSSRLAMALLRGMDSADRSLRLGRSMVAALVLVHAFARGRLQAADLFRGYGEVYLRTLARTEPGGEELRSAFQTGYRSQADALAVRVDDVWERLDAGDELLPALDRFRAEVAEVRGALEGLCARGLLRSSARPLGGMDAAAWALVPSYLHMMHNRLGTTMVEEAYLAHVASAALAAAFHPAAPR